MPHGLRLGEPRKPGRRLALERTEPRHKIPGFVEIDAGHLGAADLENQSFLDFERMVAREGAGDVAQGSDVVHASTCLSALA